MKKYYTDEKNAQVVIALLKAHGIKKVVASPGATNIPIVGSIQNDSFFEVYSSVDERSAAYIACGLAAESGEPVVLSCTGATASRNYLPGMTEAYYRKLPVAAITSSLSFANIGHLTAQLIDRSSPPNDVVRLSVTVPYIKDAEDLWESEIKVNRALLELHRHGGGPVHINLCTNHTGTFSTKELPQVRVIRRVTRDDLFPEIPPGKTVVFIGAHKPFTREETETINAFCHACNAVVLCDHTSNYKGAFRVLSAIAGMQDLRYIPTGAALLPDTIIHIGEVSGDYSSLAFLPATKQVWRVSPDGELRDSFRKLTHIFEMPEDFFFEHYADKTGGSIGGIKDYIKNWNEWTANLYEKIPELPFSNAWIASRIAGAIPEHSTLHLGILNSLRTWNCFEVPDTVRTSANTGGFGIDGCVSTLIGASLADKNRLYFGIFGDLAFFYDLNVIGNRHVGNNLRILLVNNGKGAEFRLYSHIGNQFGEQADDYIAAARHYGNRSPDLVRHYAQDLGFEYLHAADKEEFEQVKQRFLTSETLDKPVLLEVFSNHIDESNAVELLSGLEKSPIRAVKQAAQKILPRQVLSALKSRLR